MRHDINRDLRAGLCVLLGVAVTALAVGLVVGLALLPLVGAQGACVVGLGLAGLLGLAAGPVLLGVK